MKPFKQSGTVNFIIFWFTKLLILLITVWCCSSKKNPKHHGLHWPSLLNEFHVGALWDPKAHPTNMSEGGQSETDKQVFLPTLLTYQDSAQWKKSKFASRDVVWHSLWTGETPEPCWLGSSALQNLRKATWAWVELALLSSLGKTKACHISYMENQSRLQIFLRLFFEKETFCSENKPVNGVFPLINLMHLTELPQLGGPDFGSILDEDRWAQWRHMSSMKTDTEHDSEHESSLCALNHTFKKAVIFLPWLSCKLIFLSTI